MRRVRQLSWFTLIMASLGVLPALGATVPQAPVQWTVDLGVPIYNSPRIRGNIVYLDSAQSLGPNVFALKNGKVLWRFASLGMIPMAPTLGASTARADKVKTMSAMAGRANMAGIKDMPAKAKGSATMVFVASDIGDTHFMRALNADTGKWIWQYTRNKAPQCMCSHSSHYSGGMLFAQTDGHSLYAFKPVGNQAMMAHRIWQFPGDGTRLTAPVLQDGIVVFASADHKVYAIRASDGTVVWTVSTGYGFVAAPVIVKNTVIIGNRGGTLHAYRLGNGKSLWSFSANGPINTTAVARDGMIYFAAGRGDRGIYALALRTGKQIWNYQMADYTRFAPVLAGNMVLAASRDGNLVALNATAGQRIWDRALGGTPFSRPRLDGQTVVLKVGDHAVRAFNFKTGTLVWTYENSAVVTAPAVAGSMICVATSSGLVVALK
ncbi:MAG: PQQ-binding-like beta-propeller repeat protein [Phycisphaerae bacterium]